MMKNKNVKKYRPAGLVIAVLLAVLGLGGCDTGGLTGKTYSLSLNMVSVPAGSFQYSDTSSDISTVSAFSISDKEITRAQFEEIMGTDPSSTSVSTGTSDPVQYINWYDAVAFCNKLSIAEGLSPVYSSTAVTDWEALTLSDIPSSSYEVQWTVTQDMSASGYRLPTQMEWLWAAIGAASDSSATWTDGVNTTGYDKGYAGSGESGSAYVNIGDYAWYKENSNSTTHPAGTKSANELGIYDMSGNVFEWCWDHNALPSGAVTDYTDSLNSTTRMIRGGYFASDYSSIHFTYKMGQYPYARANWFGFRVVKR